MLSPMTHHCDTSKGTHSSAHPSICLLSAFFAFFSLVLVYCCAAVPLPMVTLVTANCFCVEKGHLTSLTVLSLPMPLSVFVLLFPCAPSDRDSDATLCDSLSPSHHQCCCHSSVYPCVQLLASKPFESTSLFGLSGPPFLSSNHPFNHAAATMPHSCTRPSSEKLQPLLLHWPYQLRLLLLQLQELLLSVPHPLQQLPPSAASPQLHPS